MRSGEDRWAVDAPRQKPGSVAGGLHATRVAGDAGGVEGWSVVLGRLHGTSSVLRGSLLNLSRGHGRGGEDSAGRS